MAKKKRAKRNIRTPNTLGKVPMMIYLPKKLADALRAEAKLERQRISVVAEGVLAARLGR